MKRKLEDLSLDDQTFTRKVLMEAATQAAANGTIEEFMESLLTPSEQIMCGRRLWIGRMLLSGKQFEEIGARLLVGPNTVQKIEKQLLGEIPDYGETIKINRRKATSQKRKLAALENPYSLTALKQKYPLHFMFFPWPKWITHELTLGVSSKAKSNLLACTTTWCMNSLHPQAYAVGYWWGIK